MSSHSIVLTQTGFRVISSEFQTDIISSIFLTAIILTFIFMNPGLAIYIMSGYAISLLIYIYFKKKIGYLYPIAFFYQISLFFLAVPIAVLSWIPFLFSFLILFLVFLRNNPFRILSFPPGVFLISILVSLSLLFFPENIYNFYENPLHIPFIDNSREIIAIFYPPLLHLSAPFSHSSYSILENLGLYSLIFLTLAILKEDNMFMELIFILSFFGIVSVNMRFDFALLFQQNIIVTVLWYLFHSAPGRSDNSNYTLTAFSLICTLSISVLFISFHGPFAPFLNLLFYFLSRSLGHFILQYMGKKSPIT